MWEAFIRLVFKIAIRILYNSYFGIVSSRFVLSACYITIVSSSRQSFWCIRLTAKSTPIVMRLPRCIRAWLFGVSLRVDIAYIRLDTSIVCCRERIGSPFEGKNVSPRLRNIRRILKKSRDARHCVQVIQTLCNRCCL